MTNSFISWAELDHFLAWVRGRRCNFSEAELRRFNGFEKLVQVHSQGDRDLDWTEDMLIAFAQVQSGLDCDFDDMPLSPDAEAEEVLFPPARKGELGYSEVAPICLYTRVCRNDRCPRKLFCGPRCIATCLTY